MAEYETQEWADDASGGTPINAAALNHMESGIAQASQDATNATGDASIAKTNASTALVLANNAVKKTGDTMTGALTMEIPLAASSGGTGQTSLQATRNAMGLGNTIGALPVANGGTGITSSPSMLTNLGSTSAANVFAGSPRPGITGTLSIAHGGTGQTGSTNFTLTKASTASTWETIYAKQFGKVVCICGYCTMPAQSGSWFTTAVANGAPKPSAQILGFAIEGNDRYATLATVETSGAVAIKGVGGAAPPAGSWWVTITYVAQ